MANTARGLQLFPGWIWCSWPAADRCSSHRRGRPRGCTPRCGPCRPSWSLTAPPSLPWSFHSAWPRDVIVVSAGRSLPVKIALAVKVAGRPLAVKVASGPLPVKVAPADKVALADMVTPAVKVDDGRTLAIVAVFVAPQPSAALDAGHALMTSGSISTRRLF